MYTIILDKEENFEKICLLLQDEKFNLAGIQSWNDLSSKKLEIMFVRYWGKLNFISRRRALCRILSKAWAISRNIAAMWLDLWKLDKMDCHRREFRVRWSASGENQIGRGENGLSTIVSRIPFLVFAHVALTWRLSRELHKVLSLWYLPVVLFLILFTLLSFHDVSRRRELFID